MKQKLWTMMVYMAGDNNLELAGIADLMEMKKIGSNDDINVLVQFDKMNDRITRRFYITSIHALEKDCLFNLPELNTGDPKNLKDFIFWSIENYPARHYILILWNHGNGWKEDDIYRIAANQELRVLRKNKVGGKVLPFNQAISFSRRRCHRSIFSTSIKKLMRLPVNNRAICFDDSSKDFLDNTELKDIISSACRKLRKKIDILGFDACLMNMVELCYQVHESVDYIVGSEETEPGDGWPYDKILKSLTRNPSISPYELSENIVKNYVRSYWREAVTLSAVDVNRINALSLTFNNLVEKLLTQIEDPFSYSSIARAAIKAQRYSDPDYIDLYDFIRLLSENCDSREIKNLSSAVMETVSYPTDKRGCVFSEAHKGSHLMNSHGLSIYFPLRRVSPFYKNLDFSKMTRWDEFLHKFIGHA